MTLKINLEKAYDKVSWDFLQATLHRFDFPTGIIQMTMWEVESSMLSMLWNGGRLKPFQPSRGLKQGTPLSPYLFVLYVEILTFHIHELNREGSREAIQISREAQLCLICCL
uniref:LINE-1 reverse transcriptase isogeny n=1 Tax=Cajanus cajan TaxID=3821 RepID=A0A151TT38_CAJCA|nr:LINE-1 reverse transcriptase isogeny [Cajanus cajan]